MKISTDNDTGNVQYGEDANILSSKIYTLDAMEVISDDGTVSQSMLNNYAFAANTDGGSTMNSADFDINDITPMQDIINPAIADAIESPVIDTTEDAEESIAKQANIEDVKLSGNTDKAIAFAEYGFNIVDNANITIRNPDGNSIKELINNKTQDSNLENNNSNSTEIIEELDLEMNMSFDLNSLTSTRIPIDSISDVSLDAATEILYKTFELNQLGMDFDSTLTEWGFNSQETFSELAAKIEVISDDVIQNVVPSAISDATVSDFIDTQTVDSIAFNTIDTEFIENEFASLDSVGSVSFTEDGVFINADHDAHNLSTLNDYFDNSMANNDIYGSSEFSLTNDGFNYNNLAQLNSLLVDDEKPEAVVSDSQSFSEETISDVQKIEVNEQDIADTSDDISNNVNTNSITDFSDEVAEDITNADLSDNVLMNNTNEDAVIETTEASIVELTASTEETTQSLDDELASAENGISTELINSNESESMLDPDELTSDVNEIFNVDEELSLLNSEGELAETLSEDIIDSGTEQDSLIDSLYDSIAMSTTEEDEFVNILEEPNADINSDTNDVITGEIVNTLTQDEGFSLF